MAISRESILITLLVMAFSGCGHALIEINEKTQSMRGDIFTEIRKEGTIPYGFTDLNIKVSIKTHDVGYYFEPESSLHGRPGYPFVLNIDGQAVVWKVEGYEEHRPVYDKEGEQSPEGGKGRRYNLDKIVRLAAGAHRVFFGLPGEEYYKEIDLTLRSGESYTLEYRPIYEQHVRKRLPSFVYGVKQLEVYLNGVPIH